MSSEFSERLCLKKKEVEINRERHVASIQSLTSSYSCIYMHTLTHIDRCKNMHKSIYYTHRNYTYILCTHILQLYIHHIHILHPHTPHTHTIPNSIFNDLVNNLPVYFIQIVLKRLNLKVKPLSLSSAKIQAHYSLDCQPAQRALSLG